MEIKVLSYNIHKGQSWPIPSINLDKIKDAILTENPDIVFLQEVIGDNRIPWHEDERWRKANQYEILADTIWNNYSYAKNAVYEKGHHGNVILSKFPIKSWNQEDISTNPLEQRGILYCEIEIESDRSQKTLIHAYCLHLNLLHSGRIAQYEKIFNRLNNDLHHNSHIIVAGDFNDWNKKASHYFENKLKMKEAHKLVNHVYAKTFPTGFPVLSLDRIYIKNFSVISSHVGNSKNWRGLSDHCPVIVTLELNESDDK